MENEIDQDLLKLLVALQKMNEAYNIHDVVYDIRKSNNKIFNSKRREELWSLGSDVVQDLLYKYKDILNKYSILYNKRSSSRRG